MLEAIINYIKNVIGFFIFIFIILLTALQGKFMYGGYVPTGEFYAKTDPTAFGDAGAQDVIDIELEKNTYYVGEKIVAKIGFGTKSSSRIEHDNFYINILVNGDFYNPITIEYDEEFSASNFPVYEEKSRLDFLGHYWYWYPDFYPEHHFEVELDIPTYAPSGTITIIIDDSPVINQRQIDSLVINYEIIDDQIIFND